MEALLFKNFTNEDFTWKFNGIPHTFKAGQEVYLEDYKAYHFAKHLVDKEMNRLGIDTSLTNERKRLGLLCFPTGEAISTDEALQVTGKLKAKAPKKSAKKKATQVEDEEFEDLEEVNEE